MFPIPIETKNILAWVYYRAFNRFEAIVKILWILKNRVNKCFLDNRPITSLVWYEILHLNKSRQIISLLNCRLISGFCLTGHMGYRYTECCRCYKCEEGTIWNAIIPVIGSEHAYEMDMSDLNLGVVRYNRRQVKTLPAVFCISKTPP